MHKRKPDPRAIPGKKTFEKILKLVDEFELTKHKETIKSVPFFLVVFNLLRTTQGYRRK
jgi:hypothetical protein